MKKGEIWGVLIGLLGIITGNILIMLLGLVCIIGHTYNTSKKEEVINKLR